MGILICTHAQKYLNTTISCSFIYMFISIRLHCIMAMAQNVAKTKHIRIELSNKNHATMLQVRHRCTFGERGQERELVDADVFKPVGANNISIVIERRMRPL